MVLTEEQEKLKESVFHFLLSDEKEFTISGAAGTGKSFFLKHIQNTIMKEYVNACKLYNITQTIDTIHYCATTNKAAALLEDNGVSTNVGTVHSLMGLKVRNNFNTGETYLTKTGKEKLGNNSLIIIDESSMLSQKERNLINEISFIKHTNNKIIYVGDKNQLSSPKSNKFSVFNINHIKGYDLKTVIRSQNSPNITKLNTILRDNVDALKYPELSLLEETCNIIGKQELINLIKTKFIVKKDTVFLAYTNNTVNTFINDVKAIHNLPDLFQQGDIVINSTYVEQGNTFIGSEEEFTVKSVDNTLINRFDTLECILPCYKLTLENVNKCINVRVPIDINEFNSLLKQLSKENKWNSFFNLKNTVVLREGYAQTIHKSQGSTYKNVIIDVNDSMICKCVETKLRLLYVACSRATDNIYLFNSEKD
jgi:ATP-dependent exoDNAse (exonuclease V) alpha subunit